MSRGPGYLALITSENASSLQGYVGHKVRVAEIKQILARDDMGDVRSALVAAYAEVEDALKNAWRQVAPILGDAINSMPRNELDIVQFQQNKYSAKMHEDVCKRISNLINQNLGKFNKPFEQFTAALKSAGVTDKMTMTQYVHMVEAYVDDLVNEVASTLGHDPEQRGTNDDNSARAYHMQAARSVASNIFILEGALDNIVRAAASKAYPALKWDNYEDEARITIEHLKNHIYALADEHREWGLAPILNPKVISKPSAKVSYWERVHHIMGRASPSAGNNRSASPPKRVTRGAGLGLGQKLTSTIKASAPTGEYDEDVKHE